jgi:hypothetical protein
MFCSSVVLIIMSVEFYHTDTTYTGVRVEFSRADVFTPFYVFKH